MVTETAPTSVAIRSACDQLQNWVGRKRNLSPLRHLFEQATEALDRRADVEVLLRRPDIGGDVA